MRITWDWFLRTAQIIGLTSLLISLSLSNYFMSLSSFVIVGAWVLDVGTMIYKKEPLRKRFSTFTGNTAALVLTSLFFLVALGMIHSQEVTHGWWDLRMKLPFLFMPLVMSGLRPVTALQFRNMLLAFLGSLVLAVTLCLLVYFRWLGPDWKNVREVSIFISHIRFSLLLVFGISIILFVFMRDRQWRFLAVAALIYFLVFLWIIESITGFIVLFFVLTWFLVHLFHRMKMRTMKWMIPVLFLAFIASLGSYLHSCYSEYFIVKDSPKPLEEFTARGAVYSHEPSNYQLENGHYIKRYISWAELEEAWPKRSAISLDSADALGNPVKGTLVRYLASMGLRKDMDGVNALSEEDVKNIENGITSHEQNHRGIRRRIDKILFEYDAYINGDNPSGHSVIQRIEFWKAARGIIDRHFWFGVGTGDVPGAFKEQYGLMNSRLDPKHQLRAHNQYLTFWVSTGIVGLLWFLVVMFYPLFSGGRWRDPLYVSLIIIVALSCITEDTLETQAGVTFYVFLSSFLLFLPRISTSGSQLPPG